MKTSSTHLTPHLVVRFPADDAAARSTLRDALEAVLATRREAPRLRVILASEGLGSETIGALIAALRRLRDRGGALEVVAETDGAAAALRLTGLDRVFSEPIAPDTEPRRPSRRRGLLRRVAASGLALAAALGLAAPARSAAAPLTDPDAIVARVTARNPSLASYQGRLHVDLRMVSFPYLRQHLDATTYYKKPSNYEVVFDRVPSYAKGFSKIFADVGDPAEWKRRFVMTYEGQKEYHGHADAELRLVLRQRGMIDHETALVDTAAGSIDEIRYDYYNGGQITMTQTFSEIGGYTLLVAQTAVIQIPYVHAVASGSYDDYRTNVAVDDAVFSQKN